MIYPDFNPVERLNPLINISELPVDRSLTERIVSAAVPIMQMYGPTKNVATAIGVYQKVTPIADQVVASYRAGNNREAAYGLIKVIGAISSIAFTILCPFPVMAASYTYQFYSDLNSLKDHLSHKNFRLAAEDLLRILNNLVYVGVAVVGGPELLLLSFLLQAGKEIYQARHEFQQKNKLEGTANLVYAFLRILEAKQHANQLHRDWFAEDISQEQIEVLLMEAARIVSEKTKTKELAEPIEDLTSLNPVVTNESNSLLSILYNILRSLNISANKIERLINKLLPILEKLYDKEKFGPQLSTDLFKFDRILQLNNFSNRIKSITIEDKVLSQLDFDSVSFANCHLKNNRIIDSKFYKSKFSDSGFYNNEFRGTLVDNCLFTNCHFDSNKIFDFKFVNTIFTDSSFTACEFFNGEWVSSKLNEVFMNACHIFGSTFNQCSVTNSQMSGRFEKMIFDSCQTKGMRMVTQGPERTLIEDSHFVNSKLIESEFNGSLIDGTEFENCNLFGSHFNDASIVYSKFISCVFPEVSFFDVRVMSTKIEKSNLENTLFFDSMKSFQIEDSTKNTMTKPVIAMLWHFGGSGTAHANAMKQSIQEAGGIVFRVKFELENVDSHKLDIETTTLLNQMENVPSRPQELLAQAPADGEIAKVKNLAARAAQHIQGVFLQGGEDIQPILYSKRVDRGNDDDFARSTAEGTFLNEAKNRGLAVLGVCRGSQYINVFLGGTLKKHIDDHGGVVHDLKVDPELDVKYGKLTQNILGGDRILGYSNHHQAVDKPGIGVVPVLMHEGNVEMTISENGRFVGTQFHPEAPHVDYIQSSLNNKKFMPELERPVVQELFNRNHNIFRNFVHRAKSTART